MGKKEERKTEKNPLLAVYLRILPITILAVVVIFFLVKIFSKITAPAQIELAVTYRDFESGAVMKTPMYAASDREFQQELTLVEKKKSGFYNILDFFNTGEEETPEAETGTYTFLYECRKIPETLYITSPEWWYPVKIDEELKLSAKVGAECKMPEEEGAFRITGMETVKISTGIFNINVTISSTANNQISPSEVTLLIGDYELEEWDGSSEVSYGSDNGFLDRTLVFRYNREALDDISGLLEDAELAIREYTVHKTYTEMEYMTIPEGIEVISID